MHSDKERERDVIELDLQRPQIIGLNKMWITDACWSFPKARTCYVGL